jgi:hypothetical protein
MKPKDKLPNADRPIDHGRGVRIPAHRFFSGSSATLAMVNAKRKAKTIYGVRGHGEMRQEVGRKKGACRALGS